MMQFPEREKIYYLTTFLGDWEAVGITLDNRYVFIGYTGSTNKIELYEISYMNYLRFIQAYQTGDVSMLEQLRYENYLTPCIASQSSNYEPDPIPVLSYGTEQYQNYFDFVCHHTVTEAVFVKNTVILKTEQGESLSLILKLFEEENFHGK
ncbi:MAG: hypothetical protein K2G25_07505 [Oscillospiraceae bacterium]|nr:hypothetical protein [Oscillospiraceae bacterium]